MDLSKLSTEDLLALKTGDLSKMSTEGLMELKSQQSQPASIAEQNLQGLDGQGPIDELKGAAKAGMEVMHKVGNATKAGYAGLADIIAGNGLDKSVDSIDKVQHDKFATTPAGNLGAEVGSFFTPGQIAMQAALGKAGEVIGPMVGDLMKGWAGDVAMNAVGKIKSIAQNLGITNMDAFGKFLLTPINIGGKEFPAIVTATSSPQAMLDVANAAKAAAGKQLEAVAGTVDGAIKSAVDSAGLAMNDAPVILDMGELTKNIAILKDEAVGDLPNLGKTVAKQFDDAMKDLTVFVKKQASGDTATMFSDLSTIKTKLGNLIYKHGSPLESKAALNDVYHAISDALSDATRKVGGTSAADYEQANTVYHQLASIVEGLEGKVIDAKKLFDAPAFLTALSTGLSTMGAGHGILAGPVALAGYGAAKLGEKYAPQMIAQGLNKGAPLVSGAIKLTAQGIPVIGNMIAQALKSPDEQ